MPQRNYLSTYAREHIQQLILQGATIPDILQILDCEGIATCRQTVWQLNSTLLLIKV